MFLIKLATVMAFLVALLVALLVICMLVKAIADQQKEMAILKRKNAALTLEVNQREDVLGLQADFEAILDDK
jgi:cell division protein FtsB